MFKNDIYDHKDSWKVISALFQVFSVTKNLSKALQYLNKKHSKYCNLYDRETNYFVYDSKYRKYFILADFRAFFHLLFFKYIMMFIISRSSSITFEKSVPV